MRNTQVKLTDRQAEVLKVIRSLNSKEGPVGPTRIGREMGYDIVSASSRVNPFLKKLTGAGLVKRTVPEAGVVVYEAVKDEK